MFQSTRPMRGATGDVGGFQFCLSVSIHAPHAGRDSLLRDTVSCIDVSIHAPHAGRDRHPRISDSSDTRFQSTRPMWGATRRHAAIGLSVVVSIHAPRVGRDHADGQRCPQRNCFNPRTPCGARQQKKLRLPSFATYLWVLLATNMIFSMS